MPPVRSGGRRTSISARDAAFRTEDESMDIRMTPIVNKKCLRYIAFPFFLVEYTFTEAKAQTSRKKICKKRRDGEYDLSRDPQNAVRGLGGTGRVPCRWFFLGRKC
jgi:hypothetical protein